MSEKIKKAVEVKQKYAELYPEAKIIEMSAIENFGIDTLLEEIKKILKEIHQKIFMINKR